VQVTTIASSLDQVRALATRVAKVHPEASVTAVLVGPSPRIVTEGTITIVEPRDIDTLAEPWPIMRATLSPEALASALRPALLHHVVARSGQPAIHLDADVVVLGSLEPLLDDARRVGLALVARRSSEAPRDGVRPSAADLVAAGPATLAVVAASPAGVHALWDWSAVTARWWIDRPDAEAPDSVHVVAALLARADVTLVEDDGHASWWNLDQRVVRRAADNAEGSGEDSGDLGVGRWTVGADILRTLDPRGWDLASPGLLRTDAPAPQRTRLSTNPGLVSLLTNSSRSAVESPSAPIEIAPGVPYDDRLRRLARAAIAASRRGDEAPPPDSFDDPQAFTAWATEPVWGGAAGVSRYLLAVRAERTDLSNAFPEVPGRDAAGLRQWARDFGASDAAMPAALVPGDEPPARRPFTTAAAGAPPTLGVTVAGFLEADLGVGEVARRLVHACELSSVPVDTVTYRRTRNRQRDGGEPGDSTRDAGTPDQRSDHPVNIICINADTIGAFARDIGPSFFDDRYTIGVWFWETAVLPARFRGAAELVDELWAASDLVAQALSTTARVPVLRFPLPVVAPVLDRSFSASSIDVPAGRPYLVCSYDAMSVPGRKNPVGAIEAFRAAFRDGEGPVLVVKSINGDRRPDDVERTRFAARGRSDIVIHDGYLSAGQNATLVAEATALVSLHRSEGFGFNVADAIALRTPVVATRAGGILSFCRDDDAYLVPASRVPVGPGNDPYEPTDTWAEPDLAHAAAFLRTLVDDPAAAAQRAERAQQRVLRDHHPSVTGAWIRERVTRVLAG
jgi:glycosyltransferase involved in cell wall biosynthesis